MVECAVKNPLAIVSLEKARMWSNPGSICARCMEIADMKARIKTAADAG
jgi:hypothetical protein